MRTFIVTTSYVIAAFSFCSAAAIAQGLPPGLARLKMVQPEPERAGDRALSCKQILDEMGAIMQKRDVTKVAAASKSKICSNKKVLDRQGDEKMRLQQTQTPALVAASLAPGPGANAVVAKVNAENMALERKQQPARQQATAGMMDGVADIVTVFNDPRVMRLSLLAQERQCAESAPRPPPSEPSSSDGCDDAGATPTALSTTGTPDGAPPTGPADPFAPAPKSKAAPAGSDPFSKR